MTFVGLALWVFIAAAVFGAVNLFITIADHYDKRNNEHWYKKASRVCSAIALVLVISAMAIQISHDRKEPVVIINSG